MWLAPSLSEGQYAMRNIAPRFEAVYAARRSYTRQNLLPSMSYAVSHCRTRLRECIGKDQLFVAHSRARFSRDSYLRIAVLSQRPVSCGLVIRYDGLRQPLQNQKSVAKANL